jgi:hypothetical protein
MGARRTEGRRSRRLLFAAVMLVALSLSLSVGVAVSAAEPAVSVGPAEVSTALFVAGDISRLSKVRAGTEELVLQKALQQIYADEPSLAPATAEGYIGEMRALLASSSAPTQASLQLMAGNQRILAILVALESPYGSPPVELPPAAKLAVTHLAAVALASSSDVFANAESPKYFEPLADERPNLIYTSFAPATALRATRELAVGDLKFGEAWDAIWAKASEESVLNAAGTKVSEWSQLFSESKKVLDSEALKQLREEIEAGEGHIYEEEPKQLAAIFTQGQTTTQEQACEHAGGAGEAIGGETIKGVPRLKCTGGALYEAAHAARACAKEKCEEELEALESDATKQAKRLAEQRAVMTAAGELLRPSDNTAAAVDQATTQAQTQITEAETAYANYEAEQLKKHEIAGAVKAGLGVVTSITALATDNVSEGLSGLVNVAFETYELAEEGLAHPPPGPQEVALKDLANISTQLAGFQQYTQEAFHALNTQLAQLTSQMALENYELKEELGSLAVKLAKQQETIFALQNQVQELFSVETKAELHTTIEDSVGWLRRTGEPLAPAKIQESLVALKKYATEIANGALVNNAKTQPYTFEGAGLQLTSKTSGEPTELSEAITYLAHFPVEQEWVTTPTPTTLANTTFWSEGARAYAQLMLENPGHATGPDIAGLKNLENEGVTLEQTQGAWSAHTGGTKTGNVVLDEALGHFDRAAAGAGVDGTKSVTAVLAEAAEKSLSSSLQTGTAVPGNPTNVGLWGGAQQTFSPPAVAAAKYPALKWEECSGSAGKNGKEEMPEAFIAGLPAVLVNGIRLGYIGAPKSGDPLELSVCRTIAKKAPSVATTVNDHEVVADCSNFGLVDVGDDCEVEWKVEAKNEEEGETVEEQLTLEGGGTQLLASQSVGTCGQTALYWKGAVSAETFDPSVVNGGVHEKQKVSNTELEERHVGTFTSISNISGEGTYKYDPAAVKPGTECPRPSVGEEKAGIEFANYAHPLGSVEATLVTGINSKLRELQESAYGAGAQALKSPSQGNPAASLAGARALVQSYLKLGLPQAVGSDPVLESDIEGSGAEFLSPGAGSAGPVPEQLTALIASWISRLKTATGSEIEALIKEDLIGEVAKRSAAWADQIIEQVEPYIEGKTELFKESGSEAVGEQSPLVESTINRLRLTRFVLTESKAPSAETLAPTEIGTTGVTLNGEVDPNGGAVESCEFEYGASESYGHHVECTTVPQAADKATVVSAKVTNWTPEGSLHERVVVKTWGGTTYGEDVKVQLAQSAPAPTGGEVLASTATPGATLGLKLEELPALPPLPTGTKSIVGLVGLTVPVASGGSVRARIELPPGSAPTVLYMLVHAAGGGEEYKAVPGSLYTITENVISVTLIDGGADDEDGQANGTIVVRFAPLAQAASITQPLDATVSEGESASFHAEASGSPQPSVEWEVSEHGSEHFRPDETDPGNRTTTLRIEHAAMSESGNEYRARFSYAHGAPVVSEAATLTVKLVPKPELTLEAAQEIKGSSGGFTANELQATSGQTILYQITAHNTGNVPLTLANFSDSDCGNLAGGPGGSPVAAGKSAVYSCERAVTRGTYLNQASVEGAPPSGEGFPLPESSNVLVTVGPEPSPTVETGIATGVAQRSAVANGTVDPHGAKLISCKFEYGTTTLASSAACSKLPEPGNSSVPVSAELKHLKPGATYHFRLTAASSGGAHSGVEATFKTLRALPPLIEARSASEVAQRTAIVNAAINPQGANITSCRFEYGPTSFKFFTKCASLPGSVTEPVLVSAKLEGLAPGTTFRFRVTATNSGGTAKGPEVQFTTMAAIAPTAETGGASAIAERTAVLNGTVDPNAGAVIECRFEYGKTALTLSAPCAELPGAGTSTVAVSAPLKGLTPGTTYHFRILATSLSGIGRGTEEAFTTTP